MRLFVITLSVLLFVNRICSDDYLDNIVLSRKAILDLSSDETNCTNASQCLSTKACAVCIQGREPPCDQATCINGKCNVIKRCSQETLYTTTEKPPVTTQCQGTDASPCIFRPMCAQCLKGRGPGCTQATCVNDQCQIIQPCSQDIQTTTSTDLSTVVQECKTDDECPCPENCTTECKPGSGPLCASSKCVNQRCETILPCSQYSECTPDNTNQCVIPMICARCQFGYSPPCSEATCENGKCKTISPCSIYTNPVTSSSTVLSTSSSAPSKDQCQTDGECSYVKYCLEKCPAGFGPLCAYGKCIDGNCVIANPCSKTLECTDNNVTLCAVPKICAMCLDGRSPPCAQATCDNGQCQTIMPCTIVLETTSTSTMVPPKNTCTRSKQCPRPKICEVKCPAGTGPRCASASCVNGKCVSIKPCSRRACTTRVTCPYNKLNCAVCRKGYGPSCETSTCKCGLCSVVPPCSRKL